MSTLGCGSCKGCTGTPFRVGWRSHTKQAPAIPESRGRMRLEAMDRLTPERRSALMRKVRGKHTKPEVAVRKMLFAAGYRFQLHRGDLPGSPDIVLPGRQKIVLIHGCFWHAHRCRYGHAPKTRRRFWDAKRAANVRRDGHVKRALRRLGWKVVVIWECQLRGDHALVLRQLRAFLGDATNAASFDKTRDLGR